MVALGAPRRTRPRTPPAGRRWAVLAVLCVSLLIVSLDNTILNIALPALVKNLHATESRARVDRRHLRLRLRRPSSRGRQHRRPGRCRKKVFCAGLAVFAAGSAGSAFSTSVSTLIMARSVMGLGAACIMPATLSIITNVFRDPDDQARAIGIWSATTGLGIAVGPIAGGWLLAHYWWGSVFLINVPVAVVGLAAALWLVPDSRDPQRRRIDTLGAVLSTTGLALLLWSIIEAPVRGWHSTLVIGAGAGAVVILAGFVVWERHTSAPDPVPRAVRRPEVLGGHGGRGPGRVRPDGRALRPHPVPPVLARLLGHGRRGADPPHRRRPGREPPCRRRSSTGGSGPRWSSAWACRWWRAASGSSPPRPRRKGSVTP